MGFVINVPTKNLKTISFEIVYKKVYACKLCFTFGMNGKLDTKTKLYYIDNNKIYYYYGNKIKVKPATIKNRLFYWLRRTKKLVFKGLFKVAIYRLLYDIMKIFNRKKVWLISDRPMTASDNGYAFFKYVVEQKNKKIKPIFVITKDSKDYDKVKNTGKYVIYNSIRYKLLFLLADKVISSQADHWTFNPFPERDIYYKDLYDADFIFLQHGITKDDLSKWLNCYDKNIKLFVTASPYEYDSIINGKYGYNENVVKLVGFPRFDLLKNNPQKIITIMPTWRYSLANDIDSKTGVRPYFSNFKDSEYFEFYNKLINDKALLEIMKKYDYKGLFIIHPSHKENSIDFQENEIFKVEKDFCDYSKIFEESNLLVTDYSSVAFDFAYLSKPVVYTQFDAKVFFKNHSYTKGYYDYRTDGFGPVIDNYDDTVKCIIEYIKNGCKMEDKYQKKVTNFYKYNDKNNCKRLYEEINKM